MPSKVIKSFAKKSGKTEKAVEKLWDKAKTVVGKEYKKVKPDSDKFYALTTGVLKKMLKLNEDQKLFDVLYNSYIQNEELTTDADIAIKDLNIGDQVEYYPGGRSLIFRGPIVSKENGCFYLQDSRGIIEISPLNDNVTPKAFLRKL
jgi:hypothetical protein